MRMLIDLHDLPYKTIVPWPNLDNEQVDWEKGVCCLENWLVDHVGHRYSEWAWHESPEITALGLAFRWEKHKTLFVLRWTSRN